MCLLINQPGNVSIGLKPAETGTCILNNEQKRDGIVLFKVRHENIALMNRLS